MNHPFPAEHDQQQAHALDILKAAKAFILVHFPEGGECEHPFCSVMHQHRSARVVASCSHQDLHNAINAIGEEIMIAASIETLMGLSASQRNQIAGILREEEGAFLSLTDDEE